MHDFRSLQLAAAFYRSAKTVPLSGDLKDQLIRAASSACLNLAEGRGRGSLKDQVRFFHIALGSLRECQAVLIIEDLCKSTAWRELDAATASVYRLIERAR